MRNNFAGPRFINGLPVTWWCVDLGPGQSLLLNHYSMRHDGSHEFPRCWVIQVSNVQQGAWLMNDSKVEVTQNAVLHCYLAYAYLRLPYSVSPCCCCCCCCC